MIQCYTVKERTVFKKLRKVKWIKEIYPLFGEYDFMVHATAKDTDTLAKRIFADIRSIDGIDSTKTLLETSFG